MKTWRDFFGTGFCGRWVAAAVLLTGCGDDVTSTSDSNGSAESTVGTPIGSTGGASMSDGSGSQDGSAATTEGLSMSDGGTTGGGTQATDTEGRTSDTGEPDTDTNGETGTGTDTDRDTETDTTGGTQDNVLCAAGEREAFADEFTADLGQWVLDAKWAYADGGAWGQMAGDGVMASRWNVGGGGCPTTQRVVMADPVDIGAAAVLRFAHSGELAQLDTLRVIASTDDGATWDEVIAYDNTDGPTAVETNIELDVSGFSGSVRFGFEYDNVCGDPLGVTWVLDDVGICEPQQCENGQVAVFTEDFEADTGDWVLGTHWTYDDGLNFAQPGDGVMAGYWDTLGFGGGCPTTQRVELADPLSLFGNASIAFSQAAQLSTNDTLRVLASDDDGVTWQTVAEYDNTAGLSLAAESLEFIDLSSVAGGPVRIAFEFENICGDAQGVEWGLDDIVVCSDDSGDPLPS